MKKLLMFVSLVTASLFSGSVLAATVNRGHAAELALHRVERLVLLKKADSSFLSRLQGVTVEELTHQGETTPAFKINVYQFAGTDNTRRSVEVILNQAGKTIEANVKDGSEAVGFPNWPGKDSLTLFESALHHLLHGAETDTRLKQYADSMTEFSISLGKNSQSQEVAVVDVVLGANDPILKILVKFDGKVDSVAFAKP